MGVENRKLLMFYLNFSYYFILFILQFYFIFMIYFLIFSLFFLTFIHMFFKINEKFDHKLVFAASYWNIIRNTTKYS